VTVSKVVIVAGGTSGIGREMTLGLAEAGHRVVAFGVSAGAVAGTVAEARDRGVSVDALSGDISDATEVAAVVNFATAKHGRIDALVNNAAIGPLGTVLDTDEDLFDRIVAINLKGTYLTSRAVLPHLIEGGGGSIVNIGSGSGWGKPNMAAYSASKGGVFALSAAMAYDFFHDRVRVNTVVPGGGGIVSGISLARVGGDASKLGKGAPGSVAGRPINGRDMANTVAFLVSDAAEAISGTVIDVGCFSHQGGPVARKKES
jgi:NAD(P)-dependent dehydrogenase (short-subunit alcohol dehydrogenase family)